MNSKFPVLISKNSSVTTKENRLMFNENSDKLRQDEEFDLIYKTLHKRKIKDYLKEKIDNSITKNLNLKFRNSSIKDDNSKIVHLSHRNLRYDDPFISQESSSNGHNSRRLSLKNILRLRRLNQIPTDSGNFEDSKSLRKVSFQNPNLISNYVQSENGNLATDTGSYKENKTLRKVSFQNLKNFQDEEGNLPESLSIKKKDSRKSINTDVIDSRKSVKYNRKVSMFRFEINNLLNQVGEFNKEKTNKFGEELVLSTVNKKDKQFFSSFVTRSKIKNHILKKLNSEENKISIPTPKILKRKKDYFNFKNLDFLTKQITNFKKLDTYQKSQILSNTFSKEKNLFNKNKISQSKSNIYLDETYFPSESSSYNEINKEYFNPKKTVLKNYNGCSLNFPVFKKENFSLAISINDLNDKLFQ